MIPFARMVQYGHVGPDPNILLDIDFSEQELGTRNIVDKSEHSVFSLVRGVGGIVQYDADIGTNVMVISTDSRYQTAMNTYLDLVGKNYEIHIVFKSTSSTSQYVYGTGDWNGSRIPGINFNLNQNSANYMQWFIDTGSVFNRISTGGTRVVLWEDLTLRVTSTAMVVINNRLGTTVSYPRYGYGTGTIFSLFGSYTGGTPNPFIGSVQKLKIVKIN